MKPPKKETPTHRAMLEYYVELGEKRSLTLVAKQYKKTISAVSVIAKTFGWQKKVEERDKKVADSIANDFDNQLTETKKRKLRLIRALDNKLAERLLSKLPFKVTPQDFVAAAKLEMLLLGEATERVDDLSVAGIMKRAVEHERNNNIPKTT